MANIIPTVEFYEGVSEEIANVSLRRDHNTGLRSIILMFERIRAIEKFQNFRSRFAKALRLVDEEGVIAIEPAGIKFIFGGPEGDDLKQVNCTLEVDRDDHWDRLMRFMHRYAKANGMEYGESPPPQ